MYDMHPLSGSNLATFAKVLWTSGGVAPRRLPETALAFAATLGRWPLYSLEKLYVAWKLRRWQPGPPPIFIVGHWRSGTTHLYNILSKAEFGFVPPLATGMPWDMLGLVAILRPMLEKALPTDRFIDNIPVYPDSPQEDEIALANMLPLSFYHGLYFPKRFDWHFDRGVYFEGCSDREVAHWQRTFLYFLKKLSIDQKGRQLVIKNPVYTARVAMLAEMLPEAKFVHIHRNPYDVFLSMRNFYQKLFAQFALQDHDHIDIDRIVLRNYDRMMRLLERDWTALPSERGLEIRYEDLDRAPLAVVERVYQGLGLDGFDLARPVFERYLASVTHYQKNTFAYSDEAARLVEQHWRPFIDKWGYRRPGLKEPSDPQPSVGGAA